MGSARPPHSILLATITSLPVHQGSCMRTLWTGTCKKEKLSLRQSWLCTESALSSSSWARCCISTWHSQRKVHFIPHPSASVTSRFHIRAWNSTYQGQGTHKKCVKFKQEFPSFHFCPGRMDLRWYSGRGKIFPELPRKLLQSDSKFSSLCREFLTHLKLLWAMLSLLQLIWALIWALIHIEISAKKCKLPFSQRSSNKIAAPQAEVELFRGQGHVRTEQTGQQVPGLRDGAWVVLLSSPAKQLQCLEQPIQPDCASACETGLPTLLRESNPCLL